MFEYFFIYNFFILYFSFDIVYYLLENYKNFKNIYPVHKKWYVVSNLSKSLILGFYSIECVSILYNLYVYNLWDNQRILFLGSIYSSIDLVSIIRVPKLANSTLLHHIIVNILFLYTVSNNMLYNSFSRLIAIYAVYSTLSFLVNFYLSLRIIYNNNYNIKILSTICLSNYTICCIFNWTYQIYHTLLTSFYINNYGFIGVISYIIILSFIIVDDLILIKHLYNNSFLKIS